MCNVLPRQSISGTEQSWAGVVTTIPTPLASRETGGSASGQASKWLRRSTFGRCSVSPVPVRYARR